MTDSTQLTLDARWLSAKHRVFDRLYASLNDKQREAVYTVNGPLLVLAGAGTGKTTVLVNRIAHIIRYGDAYADDMLPEVLNEETVSRAEEAADTLTGDALADYAETFACRPCAPWAILSITFTNKAANEMKERLAKTVGERSQEVWAGTFHSICVRILRRYGEHVGYRSGFTIYDTDDTKKVIAECMKQLNIDEKQMAIRTVMNEISRAKDRMLTPEMFTDEAGSDFRKSQIANIYELYQKRLADGNSLDFDDIIMQTVILLRNCEEARNYYQNRFRYVCVDEYQDTNHAQFLLTQLLSDGYRNLMVVGDDDQSIYKFRGATIENILHFDEVYKNVKIIKLEQNYRSTSNILNAANGVIRNNFGRRGKELWSNAPAGDKVVVRKVDNQNAEAYYIVMKIMDMHIREKRSYSDFAVLYRTNAQSSMLESQFTKNGLPYRIMGGTRFYERKEIKDVLAYLCIINNQADNLRLKRIINEPKRKIGDTTLAALQNIADYEDVSMLEAMKNAENYPSLAKCVGKLHEFADMIEELRGVSQTMGLADFVRLVMEKTGYMDMLESLGITEIDRVQNVKELVSNAAVYEGQNPEGGLSGFLEEVSLMSEVDNYDQTADAVVLMTIHSAKGLEFPVVFLPGMEEGLFPSIQTSCNPEELEEERRLAYVAFTRAKEKLFALHARERLIYGKTSYNQRSRFLDEIPDEYVSYEMPVTARRQPVADGQAAGSGQTPERRRRVNVAKELQRASDLSSDVGKTQTHEHFEVGNRVSHYMFGEGTILSVRETGADVLYEIAFDRVGTKKLMATYAKLKRI